MTQKILRSAASKFADVRLPPKAPNQPYQIADWSYVKGASGNLSERSGGALFFYQRVSDKPGDFETTKLRIASCFSVAPGNWTVSRAADKAQWLDIDSHLVLTLYKRPEGVEMSVMNVGD